MWLTAVPKGQTRDTCTEKLAGLSQNEKPDSWAVKWERGYQMWISALYGSDVTLEKSISLSVIYVWGRAGELAELHKASGKKKYTYIPVLFGKKMHLYLLRIPEILEK